MISPAPRLMVALLILGMTGCAAFSGYRHEPARIRLPAPLRGGAQPADVAVDLSDTNGGRHEGFATSRAVLLADVVAAARKDSYRVLEAAARVEIASGRAQEADGALLPGASIEVGGSYLRGRDIDNAGRVLDDLDYGRYEPSVSIFYRVSPGAAVAQSQRWRREADAAFYEVQDARRTAALQAGLGYLDLVLAYASSQIAERLVRDAKRFVGIAQARAQEEIGAGADFARAETEAASARQTALRARGLWHQASVRLSVLLRWNTSELLVPAERELTPAALVDGNRAGDLSAAAETGRPDLRARNCRVEAISRLARARWWELLGPEIDAEVRGRLFGREINDLANSTLAQVFVGFSFDFGELGRLRAAQGKARAAELRQQALTEQVRGEVSLALADLRIASDTIPQAQAGVKAAERSHRIQLDRFQAGTGLGLEVIEAQSALARARRGLAEAIVRYNVAQVELAAALGHLDPDVVSSSPARRAPLKRGKTPTWGVPRARPELQTERGN